jgi:hypothetical protein
MFGKENPYRVRNDNDSRFSAKRFRIFVENHLNQVFTSVYNTRKWTYWEFSRYFSQEMRPYNFWTLQEWNRFWCFWKYNNENCILRFVICRQMSFRMLEQRAYWAIWRRKKGENHVQTQIPYHQVSGQYELEVQFLAKFSDSAFFGGWTKL